MNELSEAEKNELERRRIRLYGVHTRSQSITSLRVMHPHSPKEKSKTRIS